MAEESQNTSSLQFENIEPWQPAATPEGSPSGDTGLSSRLKLKRNFDRIKLWATQLASTIQNFVTRQDLDEFEEEVNDHIAEVIDETCTGRFLSKTDEDTAAEQIGFLKGLWVNTKNLFGIAANGAAKVYSLLVNGSWGITSDGDVTAHNMTAAQLIASILKTPGFVEAVGMIGKGFGVTIDANGKAKVQTDDLIVLGRMIVNSLNIREVTYIGGTYLLTPAGSTVAKVQNLYGSSASDTRTWTTSGSGTVVGYRLLWKADDGTTGTMNYWHQGDQAFCQTYNVTETGEYEDASNRRYWRLVCRVGQTTESGVVWHYADLANVYTAFLYDKNGNPVYNEGGGTGFVGYENANGDEPAAGDKVVCLGSQSDTTRQGAVQITAEGTASIGIYDNINNYAALSTHEIHYFSKEDVRMTARRFKWTTASGESVPPTVYHGTWTQGKVSAWGDEWTYNGSNWICVYTGTTPLNITEAPGTTPAYWIENKGQKGDKGDKGDSVSYDASHSYIQYAYSNYGSAESGRDYPSDITSWSNSIPAIQKGKYLWTKDVTAYNNAGTLEYDTTYGVTYQPEDGDNVEIDTSRTYVRYSTQKTSSQPSDSTFTLTTPPTLSQGDYLWSLSQTAYVGSSTVLKSYSVSRVGIDGDDGDPGADGYTTHFAYATSADGSQNFSTTNFNGATYIGTYRDQNATDSQNYRDYVWTEWKGSKGEDGKDGTTPVKGVDYFDGEDAYSINVTPASIILNQNLNDASDYGLPRTFTISVVAGSTAKTFKVNAPSGTGLTVSRDNSYSGTEHVITLSGVSSSVSSSEISVTLTDIEGMTGTKTIKIPVFVNQLGSWTQTIENGVSTELGRLRTYVDNQDDILQQDYEAKITRSAQGLTQEFTEEISKALGTGERNLFGFHKGCKMETSNWFCVPFIQGYGVIINTSVNSYRRGRISNLDLEGQGGYFVVTFQAKLSSGSGAVNVNVCDVEATKGKGSISASAANTNISVNTSWQSYELHFYLADNTPYMDAESYNGFIDFEAQYSSNYDIYVRHLKIERGDEATEFVEADEDISYTGRAQLLGPLTLKSGVSTGITYTDSKNVSKTCNRYYYSGSSSSTPEWDEVISAKVTQDLVAGRVYTLSYWATSYNSYSNVPKIHNTFSLLNGAVIITDIGSERYDEGAGGISEGVSGDGLTLITLKHREWVRYFVRFYVTNTVSVSDIRRLVALTIYKNYNSSWYGYIYMTDIVLQEGYAMEPTRYSSLMEQSARRISLGVSDGLSRTGIDIEAGKIKAVADQFEWQNQDGEQLMGLDSNGDATFKGTIKSKNFYHGVVIYTEENSYWCKKADGGYGFVVGKYYTREQVAAMSNNVYGTPPDSGNDIFFNCIGSADFVVIKRTANDTGDIYISLPVVSDFEGKVIEIVDTRYTQPSGTSYVGALIVMQVDGAWKLKHSFTEQYGTDAIQLNGNQDHEGGVYRLLAYNGFWVRLD